MFQCKGLTDFTNLFLQSNFKYNGRVIPKYLLK